MLIAAYLVSGALEIIGIGLVVWDVRADRRRARLLITIRRPRFEASSRHNWPADPKRREPLERAEMQKFADKTARVEAELLQVVSDMLHGGKRRLIGPGLLVLGVILGTVANIAAT